jgi:hypothetical protein
METINFRPDYAKFILEMERDRFDQYYQALCTLSHERKYHGDFLKSHKVTRLWADGRGMETWSIELWGEWAGLVSLLSSPTWILALRRFDVRAIAWDTDEETIVNLGQHLQRHVTTYNVNVYSTRPGSKRQGRDRGGKGFAIGSHKSDLRITVYKRTGEPAAIEAQCSGAMLRRLVKNSIEVVPLGKDSSATVRELSDQIITLARARFNRVLELAGIGAYWPVIGPPELPNVDPVQSAFIVEIERTQADLDGEGYWEWKPDTIG